MNTKNFLANQKHNLLFNKHYFKLNQYKGVDFDKKYTMYWWSCRFYANLIQRLVKYGKILDIGCGLGHVIGRLPDRYEKYGIDINPYAIKNAQQRFVKTNFNTLDAKDLDKYNEENFDLILMRYLVEHVEKPDLIMAMVSRKVKPGGYLIIATPNPENFMARHLGDKWFGFKDPTHISIKPIKYWISLMKKNGFTILNKVSDGFWAPPYVPFVPIFMQKLIFGSVGGFQALTGLLISPVNFGEQVIIIGQKA